MNSVKVFPGELVYLKGDGDKHTARDKYIVCSISKDFTCVQKLIGSQFRSKVYYVKPTEIYSVPYSDPSLHVSPKSTKIDTFDDSSCSDSDLHQYRQDVNLYNNLVESNSENSSNESLDDDINSAADADELVDIIEHDVQIADT